MRPWGAVSIELNYALMVTIFMVSGFAGPMLVHAAAVFPDFKVFRETYDGARPQVVWTTLVADLETPVSAMLKLAEGRPNSFLLESVEGECSRLLAHFS